VKGRIQSVHNLKGGEVSVVRWNAVSRQIMLPPCIGRGIGKLQSLQWHSSFQSVDCQCR